MHQFKKFIVLHLILCIFLFAGCGINDTTNSIKITPPVNYEIPIAGEWVVQKHYTISSHSIENDIKNSINKVIYIDKNKVVLLDNVCESPSFKIKTVNSSSYLITTYGINPETLGINKSEFQVITITCKDNFFASFIKIDDTHILYCLNGVFLFLTKKQPTNAYEPSKSTTPLSKDITYNTNIHAKIINTDKTLSKSQILKQTNSGLLLGLKSYKDISLKISATGKTTIIKEPIYRTLWINLKTYSIKSIVEIPYIILPRKNGFWAIKPQNQVTKNSLYSEIYTYPIDKNTSLKTHKNTIGYDQTYYYTEDILFAGNDYISMEVSEGGTYNKNNIYKYKTLNVRPVDTLTNKNIAPISLFDLTGEEGIKTLKQGAINYLNTLDFSEREKFEHSPSELNFGVSRKNGKWILKGRLDYSNEAFKGSFGDFNIPIMPPKELIGYDSLYPNWDIIKEKVPSAIDAYSSPNRDFTIVFTNSKLFIYNIINNKLGNNPVATLDLKKDESCIMSQWATGNYAHSWDDQIKKLKN